MNWGILSPTHTHILMIIFSNVIFTRVPMAQLFWELQFIGYWVRDKVWCVMFGGLQFAQLFWELCFIFHFDVVTTFFVKLPLAWAVKALPWALLLKAWVYTLIILYKIINVEEVSGEGLDVPEYSAIVYSDKLSFGLKFNSKSDFKCKIIHFV